MIEQRIQDLFREAVFKTAVQGTRCGVGNSDDPAGYYCLYTNDAGHHCAVGHALTPELQELVGDICVGASGLMAKFPAIAQHLGANLAKDYTKDPQQLIWSKLQTIHDDLVDGCRKGKYYNSDHRPFGVSWSAWFWYRARTLAKASGFDIGNYPRHEVRDAQAA